MRRVKNRRVIRRLSLRTMKEKGWKNGITVMAIGLTSLLFTALFTVGMSMTDSIQEATMRQVGTSAHGGYKYMRMADYEKLKEAPGIRDISYNIVAGFGADPALAGIQTEVRYSEEKSAKWGFTFPENGRMPESGTECATSTEVLDALGIPHEIGARVPLSVRIGDDIVKESFTLTGYWEATGVSFAEEFWVSREWLSVHVPEPSVPYTENVLAGGMEGYMDISVLLPGAYDIEEQMNAITKWAGLGPDTHVGVNWAYLTSGVDPSSALMAVAVLLVILLSGYLVIYNIFYIQVAADVRYFGLLKTIGTTGRQLRSMVRGQAFLLSLAGIPLGLLAGWLVGRGILPLLFGLMDMEVKRVSLNPWIFLGSAVFSLLVVYLSCLRPCRLAAGVSPVKALRYSEQAAYKAKQGKKGRKTGETTGAGRKKTSPVSLFRMAAANMKRSRKKAVIVVLSLSLCLSLLNAVFTLVWGFDFDKYASAYLTGDLLVRPAKYVDFAKGEKNTDKITDDIVKRVEILPYVEQVSENYLKDTRLYLSEEGTQRLLAYAQTHREELGDERLWKGEVDRVQEGGSLTAMAYGIPKTLLSGLELLEGSMDWEGLETGKQVLLVDREENPKENRWLKAGDRIRLTQGGEELTIMGIVDMPYGMSAQYSSGTFGVKVILPSSVFEAVLAGSEGSMPEGGLSLIVDTEDGKEAVTGQALEQLLKEEASELTVVSKESLRREFSSYTNMFSVVGGLLCLILGMIGVLNFINAILTGILARKQEFAMMEAVGMTGGQLRGMLLREGLLYGIFTALMTVTVGNALGFLLIQAVSSSMDYFTWHFTLGPLLATLPFLLLLSVLVPFISYKAMCGKSIVERLRLAQV